jgi:hypothetical protein
MNDTSLNIEKIKRFFLQDESERYAIDRPYSVTEIEQILEKCDVRSSHDIAYGFHMNEDWCAILPRSWRHQKD